MDVPGIYIRGEHSEGNTPGGSFGKHTGDIRWIYWGNTQGRKRSGNAWGTHGGIYEGIEDG